MPTAPADLETLFLALGDKTRLRLLELMAGEPVTVGYLCDSLGDSQPKISRHLAYLRNSGVVTTRRDGKHIYYGLRNYDDAAIEAVLECVLAALTDDRIAKPKPPTKKTRPAPARIRKPIVRSYEVDEETDEILPVAEEPEFEPEYEPEPEDEYEAESDYEPEYYPDTSEPSEEMDVFLL